MYNDTDESCVECDPGCKECDIVPSRCVQCDASSLFNYNCEPGCPYNMYSQGNECKKCSDRRCETCSESECYTCLAGFNLTTDKKCVECTGFYYPDYKLNTCFRCHENCAECYGPETWQCKKCNGTTFAFELPNKIVQCFVKCPDGYYGDTDKICKRNIEY